MDLSKVYVIGAGRISEFLIGLGMRPFVYTWMNIPDDSEAVILIGSYNEEEDLIHQLRRVASISYDCWLTKIPLIFISNESVFGLAEISKESGKKSPTDSVGMLMLSIEAVIKADGFKTIRVQRGDYPAGIGPYLQMFKRMPQTLHLGSRDGLLCMDKARKLGIYG